MTLFDILDHATNLDGTGAVVLWCRRSGWPEGVRAKVDREFDRDVCHTILNLGIYEFTFDLEYEFQGRTLHAYWQGVTPQALAADDWEVIEPWN